ncbi:hypothetical protein IW143_004986 [Coemansia sp. RSA 520]|nr:hypothetical protein IW143_004986 [Coemansia sp. RSA 520]KAJ2423470.1 hypothetical protein IWW41_004973 [Coemansia sp. RSA 2522]
MANFAGTMVGAPSSGAILDNIGNGTNYKPTIIFSGVFMLCSSMFFVVLRAMVSKKVIERI